jgi:hypothetical protein
MGRTTNYHGRMNTKQAPLNAKSERWRESLIILSAELGGDGEWVVPVADTTLAGECAASQSRIDLGDGRTLGRPNMTAGVDSLVATRRINVGRPHQALAQAAVHSEEKPAWDGSISSQRAISCRLAGRPQAAIPPSAISLSTPIAAAEGDEHP